MKIYEAFRNRGLLVPEMQKPVYRITYKHSWYGKRAVIIQTEDWKTAKQELQEKWRLYANKNNIPEDAVIEIHCVANK